MSDKYSQIEKAVEKSRDLEIKQDLKDMLNGDLERLNVDIDRLQHERTDTISRINEIDQDIKKLNT